MSAVPQRKMTAPPANQQRQVTKVFKSSIGSNRSTWKVGIYGPEGIGKSVLSALCHNGKEFLPTYADIELSMRDLDNKKVDEGLITGWQDLRDWVASLSNCWAGIDSMTRAEDWAAQYVIENKKSNEGAKAVDSLEDFKYKAGLRFVNDEFKKLLADIDLSTRRGVSWVMTAHNRVKQLKNPEGSDFIRHEPNLVDALDVSNMRSWVQFLDVCAFVDLDISVDRKKATSGGTRTIYLDTSASHISKARGIDPSSINFVYDDKKPLLKQSCELWERLGVK